MSRRGCSRSRRAESLDHARQARPLIAALAVSLLAACALAWLAFVSVPSTAVDIREAPDGRRIVGDVPVGERAWLVGVRPGMIVEEITASETDQASRWTTLLITDGVVHLTVQRTYPAPEPVLPAVSIGALLAAAVSLLAMPTLAWWLLLVPPIAAVAVASDLVSAPLGFLLALAPPTVGALALLDRQRRLFARVPIAAVLLWGATAGTWLAAYLGRSDSWAVPRQTAVAVGVALLFLGTLSVWRHAMARARARLDQAGANSPSAVALLAATLDELIPGRTQTRLSAIERERAALATDLHAEVLPSLLAVIKSVEDGMSPTEAAARLHVVARELRELMTDRRLSVLEQLGLVTALEWLAERVEERAAVTVQLDVEGEQGARVPREVELNAYRIAQQALDNALIHGRPSQIDVSIQITPDRLQLTVTDNGAGITPGAEEHAARAGHLGLADMRQRAATIDGVLTVGRRNGRGTIVSLRWPR